MQLHLLPVIILLNIALILSELAGCAYAIDAGNDCVYFSYFISTPCFLNL